MIYHDYVWDLNPNQLILDRDLDASKLGWQAGDIFKLVNINGRMVFKKIEPLEAFLEGRQINE